MRFGRAVRVLAVTLTVVSLMVLPGVSTATGEELRTGAGGTPSRSPLVVAPVSGAPGEIVRVVASGGGDLSVVELIDGQGESIARAAAIDVRMTGAVGMRAFLIGIDSTRPPGAYTLRGLGPDGSVRFERRLAIVGHEFRSERIALNRGLTTLRGEYDPRKVEESRVLTELVLSRDPDAVFHPGRLAWPLPEDTRVTSLYGDRRTYVYSDGTEAPAIHVGIDLASPTGTPVHASGDGVVRMARDRIVTGKTVVIEHLPGVYSLYYHLDELAATEGELVESGSVIGTVGATGLATGPHLHWEIRVGGVAVSPASAAARGFLLDTVP